MLEYTIQETLQQNSLKLFETLPYSPETVQKNILACVVAPALNEEEHMRAFLESIHTQQTDYPVLVYIADNQSSDRTREIASEMGANVMIESVRGIGPARQNGLDALKKISGMPHSNIVLIQTDTDGVLYNNQYIQKVCEAYEERPDLVATVGPTHFPIKTSHESHTMVRGGRQFKEVFNTHSFSELFAECGRDISDYLLAPPYRMLIGANASYRLSELETLGIEYPKDTRWESVIVSVLLQMNIPSDRIGFIPQQEVVTSARAYSDDRGMSTEQTLTDIRTRKYIKPFKSNDSVSPVDTLRTLIELIDKHTYDLGEHEQVKAYESDYPVYTHPNQRVAIARHAGTGLEIPGKFVIIEKELEAYRQEAVRHAQADIRIIKQIQQALEGKRLHVLLDSGYAVESLVAQTIQRYHDDIDLIIVAEHPDIRRITRKILSIIDKESKSWRSEETKANWIWLRNYTQDTTAPKQINIHVVNGKVDGTDISVYATNGSTYTIQARQTSITAGTETLEILSPEMDEMTASKIRLIEPYGNKPRMKDIFDITRMVANSRFSRERCIEILAEYYIAQKHIDADSAAILASEQVRAFEQKNTFLQ